MGSLTDHKNAALPGVGSISDREIQFWSDGGYIRGIHAKAVEVDDFIYVTNPTPEQTTVAIEGAVAAAGASRPVRFTPNRTYLTTRTIYLGTKAYVEAYGAKIEADPASPGHYLLRNIDSVGGNPDITVLGGEWNPRGDILIANANWLGHGFYFRNCDRLYVQRGLKIKNALKWGILIADSDDVNAGEIVFETLSDGIHCHGPMKRPFIHNLRGITGDDFIAFTTNDYPGYSTSIGDFEDIEIDGLYPQGSVTACAFLGDPGRSFKGNNTIKNLKGTVVTAGVRVVNDPNTLTQTDGDSFTFQNIAIDNGNNATPIINLSAHNLRDVLIEGMVHTDNLRGVTVGVGCTIGNLIVKSLRSPGLSGESLVIVEGTVSDLVFDGVTATLGAAGKVFQVAGSVTRASLSGVFTTGGTALFTQNPGTPAMKVFISNSDCQGLTYGAILGSTITMHLSNVRIGASYTFYMNNAAVVARFLAGVVGQDTLFRPVAFVAGATFSASGEMLIMDTSGADAINAPQAGDRVRDRVSGKLMLYNGAAWVAAY